MERFLQLDDKQRRHLFSTLGVNVRRLAVNSKSSAAVIVDRTCAICLLSSDMPGVRIDALGICNQCREFQAQSSGPATELSLIRDVVARKRGSGRYDSVVAFSGGKDSAAALLVAQREHGLRPVSVLVDNGFIPDEVKDSAKRFCEDAGSPLVVAKIDIRPAVRASLGSPGTSIPCTSCMRGIFRQVAGVCRELGTLLVIGGHRFPPLAFPVSGFTREERDEDLVCASLLLARRIPEHEQLAMIGKAGWRRIEMAGNTSNCKLIGYIERNFYEKLGYNPHIYEVSKEIRAGFYSREEGFKKIERPDLSEEHNRFVEHRLGRS